MGGDMSWGSHEISSPVPFHCNFSATSRVLMQNTFPLQCLAMRFSAMCSVLTRNTFEAEYVGAVTPSFVTPPASWIGPSYPRDHLKISQSRFYWNRSCAPITSWKSTYITLQLKWAPERLSFWESMTGGSARYERWATCLVEQQEKLPGLKPQWRKAHIWERGNNGASSVEGELHSHAQLLNCPFPLWWHISQNQPCHHIGPSISFKKAFPSSIILALSVQTNLQWMIFIEEWPSSMTLLSWMLFDTVSKEGCYLGAGPNHSNREKPFNVKASNFLGRENICLILHQFFSWRPYSSFWTDLFSYSCILKKVHILGHSWGGWI